MAGRHDHAEPRRATATGEPQFFSSHAMGGEVVADRHYADFEGARVLDPVLPTRRIFRSSVGEVGRGWAMTLGPRLQRSPRTTCTTCRSSISIAASPRSPSTLTRPPDLSAAQLGVLSLRLGWRRSHIYASDQRLLRSGRSRRAALAAVSGRSEGRSPPARDRLARAVASVRIPGLIASFVGASDAGKIALEALY